MKKNVDAADIRGFITVSTQAKRRVTQHFEYSVFGLYQPP